jgi:hypothetical protein
MPRVRGHACSKLCLVTPVNMFLTPRLHFFTFLTSFPPTQMENQMSQFSELHSALFRWVMQIACTVKSATCN